MNIREEYASAQQEGLVILELVKDRSHRPMPEEPVAELLRLLTRRTLTPRATDRVAEILGQVTEQEIVAAIRESETYQPLCVPRGVSSFELPTTNVDRPTTPTERLMHMIAGVADQHD